MTLRRFLPLIARLRVQGEVKWCQMRVLPGLAVAVLREADLVRGLAVIAVAARA